MSDYPEKTCAIENLVTHKRFTRAALTGDKTQQRRDGVYGHPGETFQIDGHDFLLTTLERQKLDDISEEDARREGFDDLAAYKDLILRMHRGMAWDGDALVWVHSFERVVADA